MEPRGRDHRGRRLRRPGRCAAPSSASRPEHPPLPLPASPSAAAGRCRRRRRPQSPPGARRPPSRRARSVFWLRRPSQAPLPRPPRRPAGGSIGVGSTGGARNGSASGLSGRRGREERRARPAVEPVRRHAIRAGSRSRRVQKALFSAARSRRRIDAFGSVFRLHAHVAPPRWAESTPAPAVRTGSPG